MYVYSYRQVKKNTLRKFDLRYELQLEEYIPDPLCSIYNTAKGFTYMLKFNLNLVFKGHRFL